MTFNSANLINTQIPSSSETTFQKEKCDKGWTHFNGNCYKLTEEELNWHESVKVCRQEDADLASIHSLAEQYFIRGKSNCFQYVKVFISPSIHS